MYKVKVISLKKRQDRRKKIARMFQHIDFEFCDGIDGETYKLTKFDKEFVKVIKPNNFKPSISDYPKKNIIYNSNSNLKRISKNTSINTNIKINVSIGDNVTHEKFGLGNVINIEGN